MDHLKFLLSLIKKQQPSLVRNQSPTDVVCFAHSPLNVKKHNYRVCACVFVRARLCCTMVSRRATASWNFPGEGIVTCCFTYQLKKVIGTFKMFLHSYLIVNAAHTTYCYWQGCGVGGKSSDSGFPKFPSPTPQHKRNEIWLLKSMEILVHSSKRSLFQ